MMGEFILAPEVEAELDAIWLRIAQESGSVDIANRVIDNITGAFLAVGTASLYWPPTR